MSRDDSGLGDVEACLSKCYKVTVLIPMLGRNKIARKLNNEIEAAKILDENEFKPYQSPKSKSYKYKSKASINKLIPASKNDP